MEVYEDEIYPINIVNLNYGYDNIKILKNICCNIKKNKFYTILGPNGSGKTTLLKNICNLLNTNKKCVYINNTDITTIKNKELSQKISYVPQNTLVNYDFSVMDIVLMGRNPYIKKFHSETKKDCDIVKRCMQLTNIWNLRNKSINQLSGGECQKVIIARALAQETDIMLLDEPTSSLDIKNQIEILNVLKKLTNKITIITILHDLNLASQYSDYILLLKDGEIASMGSPFDVLTKENISDVYGIDVYLTSDPITHKPHIIPLSSYFKTSSPNLNSKTRPISK